MEAEQETSENITLYKGWNQALGLFFWKITGKCLVKKQD